MERFIVPQFIEVEAKIIGPITARQFVIMLATAFFIFLTYNLLDFVAFLVVGLIEFAIGGTLAFIRINGQPFHFFLLNATQTLRRPRVRVWNKNLTDAQLRAIMKSGEESPAPPPKATKQPLTHDKLSELSLIVNTGGSYRPEDWQ